MYLFDNKMLHSDFMRGYLRGYFLIELEKGKNRFKNDKMNSFNSTPFRHHTEATNDFAIAHADCIYDPEYVNGNSAKIFIKDNLKINFQKPFSIQAKSAQYWVVKSRNTDQHSGYDLDLKTWQGIPLKHYMQIQFEMALYEVDVTYLALLYNTSEKHYWQIKANKKHQADLLEIASYMKKCIDKKQPPAKYAMNSDDIRKLYPEIKDDFRQVDGAELDSILGIANNYASAAKQEKAWKNKKEDYLNSIAIFLKDQSELKGLVNDELVSIAKWKSSGGSEKIMKLSEIQKSHKRIFNYLIKNDMISKTKKSINPSIIYKGE